MMQRVAASAGWRHEMAGQVPEYGSHYSDESAPAYNDRLETAIALVGAALGAAAIIGVFMFITWVAYNVH